MVLAFFCLFVKFYIFKPRFLFASRHEFTTCLVYQYLIVLSFVRSTIITTNLSVNPQNFCAALSSLPFYALESAILFVLTGGGQNGRRVGRISHQYRVTLLIGEGAKRSVSVKIFTVLNYSVPTV